MAVCGVIGRSALCVTLILSAAGCGGWPSAGATSGLLTSHRGLAQCRTRPDDCNGGARRTAGTLAFGLVGAVRTLSPIPRGGNDPVSDETAATMLGMLAPSAFAVLPSGAVRYNDDLLAREPALTETSPPTIVYRIQARARWSDGMPISARDFEYTWRMWTGTPAATSEGSSETTGAARPATAAGSVGANGGAASMYALISSVTGTDNGKTVTVALRSSTADWRSLFAALAPAHVANLPAVMTRESLSASSGAFDGKPGWSGGPYQVSAFAPGRQVEFVPNPAWYGRPRSTLEKVVFRCYEDEASAVAALERGELDGIEIEPDRDTATRVQALAATGVDSQIVAGRSWVHLDLNSGRPYLENQVLRQAVLTGINTETIVRQAVGEVHPAAIPRAAHYLFPGQVGYRAVLGVVAPDQGSGRFDTARAALSTAGFTWVDSALSLPSGTRLPTLRLRYQGTESTIAATAGLIRDQLARLGVAVAVEPALDLAPVLSTGDFDLVLVAEVPGSAAAVIDRWRGGANPTRWHSPEFDQLLDRAVVEPDELRRADLLNRGDEVMTGAAVALPLYQRPRLLALSRDYVNIRENPAGGILTYNAGEWGVRVGARD